MYPLYAHCGSTKCVLVVLPILQVFKKSEVGRCTDGRTDGRTILQARRAATIFVPWTVYQVNVLACSFDTELLPAFLLCAAVQFINNTRDGNKNFQTGKNCWIKTHPWADASRTIDLLLLLLCPPRKILTSCCPNPHVDSSLWNLQLKAGLSPLYDIT